MYTSCRVSDAQVQEEAAQLEAEKANEESEKAMTIENEAEKELGEAKPAMEAAATVANTAREEQRTVYRQWKEDSQDHHIMCRQQIREVIMERNAVKDWTRPVRMAAENTALQCCKTGEGELS